MTEVQVYDGDGVPPADKPLIVKVRDAVAYRGFADMPTPVIHAPYVPKWSGLINATPMINTGVV